MSDRLLATTSRAAAGAREPLVVRHAPLSWWPSSAAAALASALAHRTALVAFFLALVCLIETLAFLGERSGFYATSRPQLGQVAFAPADGYVMWWEHTPVSADAYSFLYLAQLFLGAHGPEHTGQYDWRAGYAFLGALLVQPLGYYAAFISLNWLFWTAAAFAGYWLARRALDDELAAVAMGVLIATAQGFTFTAGQPMSHLAGFALVAIVLALAERWQLFERRAAAEWAAFGWILGLTSLFYFVNFILLGWLWLYGARRAPWRCLIACTAVALAIPGLWEVYGRHVVGLEFGPQTASITAGAAGWIRGSLRSPFALLEAARNIPLLSMLAGAIYYPWWALAGIGWPLLSRERREWCVALAVPAILGTVVISAYLPLPRIAYFMYPAVFLPGAAGIAACARAVARLVGRVPRLGAQGRPVLVAVALSALLLPLVAITNAPLLGHYFFEFSFHYGLGSYG